MALILSLIVVAYHFDGFANTEPHLHTGNKSQSTVVYEFFNMLLDECFDNFALRVIRDIGL